MTDHEPVSLEDLPQAAEYTIRLQAAALKLADLGHQRVIDLLESGDAYRALEILKLVDAQIGKLLAGGLGEELH